MKYRQLFQVICVYMLVVMSITSCQQAEPRVVYITATPQESNAMEELEDLPTIVPQSTEALITQNPIETSTGNREYVVIAGDTLSRIADEFNTSIETIIELNNIIDPNIIEVGQVIKLPPPPSFETNSTTLLVNSRLLPDKASQFDVQSFLNTYGGDVSKEYQDTVIERAADGSAIEKQLNTAQIIEQIAIDFSVDARLLLALLEFRAQFITMNEIEGSNQDYPLISEEDSSINREGLFRQVSWAANELNRGYYSAKYASIPQILEFNDGMRVLLNPELNAATSGLYYFLSLNNSYQNWLNDISSNGFIDVYTRYFGNPLDGIDTTIPDNLTQPILRLPFENNETWYFTGGAHGGWGNGSAWSAIDFAPPDNNNLLCYTSNHWITAVADGIIARSERGTIVLDLDGDGNELTGWTILYLHVASQDRITTGTRVNTGDRIGRASCEGGFSTATHLHIARKYNGEWLPADCAECNENIIDSFTMSGWSVDMLPGQEYQGYLINVNGDETRTAEQGRNTTINRITLEE